MLTFETKVAIGVQLGHNKQSKARQWINWKKDSKIKSYLCIISISMIFSYCP
jgi:hypothetical protein